MSHGLALAVAFGLLSMACEDEAPAVTPDGAEANGGSGNLERPSTDGIAGSGESNGNAHSGGGGGVASVGAGGSESSDGRSTAARDGSAVGGSGGSGGAGGGGVGGSGGNAGANPVGVCEDDPRCAAFTEGSFCVGNFSTTCEDVNADGCLEFSQANCAPRVCDDGACGPVSTSDGEACGDSIDVASSGFALAGADFGAAFGHDLRLEHDTCDWSGLAAPEAVFHVALEAGQRLSVAERGGLDAVAHIQPSCGADQACLVASDSVDYELIEYTATGDETVSVVVEAWDDVPNPAWYRLRIDIDAECGNGLLEGFEDCDVGDLVGSPGCTEACSVEFGYECSETSPSLCTPLPSLGEFAASDSIASVVSAEKFEVWDEDLRLFTFTEAVVLDLEARTLLTGTGDVNVEITSPTGQVALYPNTGDEVDQPLGLAAGTYVIRVYAETPLPEGYRLDFELRDPGECGDGELEPLLEQCDTGGEPGCTDACEVEFGYLCEGEEPSVCEAIESIGELAPDEQLEPVVAEEALAAGESSYWLFTLSEDAVLSCAVSANGALGDPDVWLYSTTGYYPLSWESDGDESFALPLPAGDYKIQVYAHDALDNGYTLTLSTTAD